MSLETIFIIFYFYNIVIKSQFQNYPTKTCKNKNGYYHSLKTRLGGRLRTRLNSQIKKVNTRIKMIIIIILRLD